MIKSRKPDPGRTLRPKRLTLRISEEVSNELAQVQGLLKKYGGFGVADLFEAACMPRIRDFIGPYVEMAKLERERAKAQKKAKAGGAI